MGKNSNISWTQATWNPWMGCSKITKGCKNCYMFRILKDKAKSVIKNNTMYTPLKWVNGKNIFTCSMSDFFIEEADEWRDKAWEVIKKNSTAYISNSY